MPSAPLLYRVEILDHEQILANQSVARTIYEGFGEVRQAVPAARFSDSPSAIAGPAPRLGEHSRQILDALGYDEARCSALVASGAVVADQPA